MAHIDWLHAVSAILFLVAALHKLYRRQGEHFFTRFLCFLWFSLTVIDRTIPVHFVRDISNYVIMLIPFVEIISPAFMRYWRRNNVR